MKKYLFFFLVFFLFLPVANADITTGLVGYWNFDEGNGTMAGDSSGSNNTGSLVNNPTWINCKVGTSALMFNV